MKYRLINEHDEITVITEDGGIACIRTAEPFDETPRVAVTDYYQMRLTEINQRNENIWEELAEGTMYCNDWETSKFDSQEVIDDALAWLGVNENSFERDDTLFLHLFK